ncbi:exopolysaccharide biosynthesis protein [Seohaeicola sp. SP36]|uniref:exopolysaccharide biosynthesis protein n=1 Tax=unclassified Seohaeicola TaxID=2641111 RepID=UPI00237C4ACE|nr:MULTISPECIES: exopolysaccharide biosynthesis protein [unclassified Seohaeicola]MDD9709544.1 exopolysaccharide biosynthesis protein [Seohaeicola sp. 4SK31]MDD9737788.1 exopolysaccharide biosynthesis protein [Seohaeicola sp. SP36]
METDKMTNFETSKLEGGTEAGIKVTELERHDETDDVAERRVPKKTLSQILTEISEDTSRDVVAVNDLIATLGGRGRAALILIFAFPNILPSPPGLAGVLGVPLIYLSIQMIMGRIPWLPRMIADRSVPRDRFAQFIARLAPLLARAERLLRPRWGLFVSHRAEHVLGVLFLVLAIVLSLPIPFGNMTPSVAMCLIALGILERDGLWVVLGVFVGLIAIVVAGGVVYAVIKSSLFLLINAFA